VVGYQIRLERKASASTRLLFCTTGILLRRLQGDGALEGVSHVVVDEIHERSLDSDFLLIILRDLVRARPDIKVVLMSATLNAELFASYFDGCPTLHIQGFTHPVAEFYLEDCLEMTGHVIEAGSDCAKEGAGLGDFQKMGGGAEQFGGDKKGGKKGGFKASDAEGAMKQQLKQYAEDERLYELYDGQFRAVQYSLEQSRTVDPWPELL
jgi:HrpA-like RNA helicase